MNLELQSKILVLFNDAIDVNDTIWYTKTETLFEAIVRTIESDEVKE